MLLHKLWGPLNGAAAAAAADGDGAVFVAAHLIRPYIDTSSKAIYKMKN